MGVSGGPKIVRDSSLVLELDAADRNSYTSGSTTWFDMSGFSNSGSLMTGSVISASYSSENLGSLLFSGPNSLIGSAYVEFTTNSIAANTFTMEVWCKPQKTITAPAEATSGIPGISGQSYVLGPVYKGSDGGAGISVGTNAISVFEHGAGYMPSLLTYASSIPNNTFSHIVVIYTNKQPSLYLNGTFIKAGLTSLRPTVYYAPDQIGRYTTYGTYLGSLSNVKIYNRALSAAEVLQNYNQLKSRFNL